MGLLVSAERFVWIRIWNIHSYL